MVLLRPSVFFHFWAWQHDDFIFLILTHLLPASFHIKCNFPVKTINKNSSSEAECKMKYPLFVALTSQVILAVD